MESNTYKRQRERRGIKNKKWTDQEVYTIFDYLEKNLEFESPTALSYYGKLIDSTGIDATPDILRWKVRNMRKSYQKVDAWLGSTDAMELESNEGIDSVKRKILKSCQYYDRLKKLFGSSSGNDLLIYDNNDDNCKPLPDFVVNFTEFEQKPLILSSSNEGSSQSAIEDEEKSSSFNCSTLRMDPDEQSTSMSYNKTVPLNQWVNKKTKSCPPPKRVNQLSTIQKRRDILERQKMQFEKKRFEREIDIQERRLKLDEDRFKAELEWKKQEHELKKLELEKDERIAKYEIDMKYKNKS